MGQLLKYAAMIPRLRAEENLNAVDVAAVGFGAVTPHADHEALGRIVARWETAANAGRPRPAVVAPPTREELYQQFAAAGLGVTTWAG